MPVVKRALTPTAVKHSKPKAAAYKLSDGGGLYLWISPAGARLWRYKFRLEGKEQTYSIGGYPEMSLAQAREEHDRARELVAKGLSPVAHRKAKKQEQLVAAKNTFAAVAREWIAERSPHWSAYYAKQVRTTMERDVFPKIGAIKIKDVTAAHLRPILKAVATRKTTPDGKRVRERGATSVAVLIRQWASAIFSHAVANGLSANDPAYALRSLVTRPKVQHHKHLAAKDIPAFMAKLKEFTGTESVKIAIELLALTFVRTGELRKAEWSEFELEGSRPVWRIPAHKMKMGREHLVPLSSRAVQLIARLRQISGHSPYLFPNQRTPGAVMTMTTINRALERMGYGGRLSGHGFRGTASTVLNEHGYPSHIIEKQLAHEKKNAIEASYNHAEYLAERVKLMQFWADFLQSEKTNVVAFKKALQSSY